MDEKRSLITIDVAMKLCGFDGAGEVCSLSVRPLELLTSSGVVHDGLVLVDLTLCAGGWNAQVQDHIALHSIGRFREDMYGMWTKLTGNTTLDTEKAFHAALSMQNRSRGLFRIEALLCKPWSGWEDNTIEFMSTWPDSPGPASLRCAFYTDQSYQTGTIQELDRMTSHLYAVGNSCTK
jgi:hypothetical protein